jgi:molecular chaperone GrpE
MSEKKDRKIKEEKNRKAGTGAADSVDTDAAASSADGDSGQSRDAAGESTGGAGSGGGDEGASGDGNGAGSSAGTAAAGEDANVKYMRLAADFQNYKKRTEKERFERYTEGKKDFAADLLPVLDNFERAIGQDAVEGTDVKFLEGMEMIYNQLIDVLAKNGIDEIPALGEEFDPNLHHAVQQIASEEYESGKVASVLQKGYKLGEKIIRPAMVIVAS